MEISKTSWHFRWLHFIKWVKVYRDYEYTYSGDDYIRVPIERVVAPKSLCPYFWMLVSSLVLTTIMLLAVLAAIITVIGVLGMLVSNPHAMIVVFVIIGAISALYTLSQILVDVGKWALNDEIDQRIYRALTKKRKPNILLNMIKAKKEKVCPLLEFTE